MQTEYTSHITYLSLGSNLGYKEENLRCAIRYIEERIGTLVSQSALYISEPWGFISENNFVNCVISVSTTLSPTELLDSTQEIERVMGRNHKTINKQYTDRIIDIDILFYDSLIIQSPILTIPHPLLHERRFVLEPMVQIAADMIHPLLQKNMTDLLAALSA